MLNSLLSISTRSILCPLYIHVLTVTTTVRTCRFSHFISTAFAIGNITHPFHERDQPLDPQSLLYSIRGYATSYGYFFAEIPSTSDLRPMHMFTTSVSPREKKNERHKSKSQIVFFFLISIFCGLWMVPSGRFILFIYLYTTVPGTVRGTIYSVV